MRYWGCSIRKKSSDIKKEKIDAKRLANRDASAEEIQKAKDYAESKQQDFSEGAAMQVKRDILQSLFLGILI